MGLLEEMDFSQSAPIANNFLPEYDSTALLGFAPMRHPSPPDWRTNQIGMPAVWF